MSPDCCGLRWLGLAFALVLLTFTGGRSGDAAQDADPPHWAYVKPIRPDLPSVKDRNWLRNPIDAFVLARLEKAGLAPSPEADRARLLRRVSLDLIGLPPTIEEVDAFVNDPRPDAYELVVDRLLASAHYGERWARHWLDLARYADSNGFQRDGFRTVWPYRDWVVRAFNNDLPFDRFTVEQLAGDLLPNATIAQKIATGFNRCTTVNVEAGVDQEEDRINAVVDRVNTTATVWLGTTMICAQCHNHKYDPFTQREYYRLFAFFNNTPAETASKAAAAREFVGPTLALAATPEQEQLCLKLESVRDEARRELAKVVAKFAAGQAAWEKQQRADKRLLGRLPPALRKILALPEGKRNKKQQQDLADHYADLQPGVKLLRQRLAQLEQELQSLAPAKTLVMVELDTPRRTHVLNRGNFLNPGARVTPGVPAVLPPLAASRPAANRLDLARWLVDADNPLTARVTVNRWWAELFGRGLVATLEDFGTQGERPTHPELLDWLATEFVRGGWSIKALHRLLVTSATYRQSARLSPGLRQKDPDNKLYGRGPRLRLDAETLRDNALAVSGLLSRRLGGPPVFPPQPAGIWTVTGVVDNTYRTSAGADRYRRGLYTIWRRSSPYPSFVAFDAPDRASCVVKRPRTNTPLQALTLMNDPVYVEAAVALAARILREQPQPDVEPRLVHGFRLCLARSPSEVEIGILTRIHQRALTRYQDDPTAARALVAAWPGAPTTDVAELAAWSHVATVLLNLDEMITKG
ncbi:MAG: DUF1549 and DUF1553 domain-containing protein [Gemmataceae bacterium]|nr:DUF1549 and DUF1553 domain-containing protein [Gemmataceae bacterium]